MKRLAFLALIGLLAMAHDSVAQAPAAAAPKLSDAKMKNLAKSLSQDDAHERITAVMVLMDLADRDPASWPRLKKDAVPALRGALARENGMLGVPKIALLMVQAIQKIERAGEPLEQPADAESVAERVQQLREQLNDKSEIKKRQAITHLRRLKLLAEPALDRLEKLAEKSTDPLTKTAAGRAAKEIAKSLWFRDRKDGDPDKPLTTEEVRERIGTLAGELTAKLKEKGLLVRLRALRSLASMKAAAVEVIPKLNEIAMDPTASKSLKMAASAALKTIELSKAASEKYKKMRQEKKAPDKPLKTETPK
jgi:hypothetical protein